jgi:hypothetical protein
MASEALAVRRRCPRHGALQVYDYDRGVWKCPVTGCFYAIPGNPPQETPEA